MSLALETVRSPRSILPSPTKSAGAAAQPDFQVIRRNGVVTAFDAAKIAVALTKAFLAVEGNNAAASRRVHDTVAELTQQIVSNLTRRADAGRTFHIEDVQDQVELALMRGEHHKVARAYVLYREERARERARSAPKDTSGAAPSRMLHVTAADGTKAPLDTARLDAVIAEACDGLDGVSAAAIVTETHRNLYDGISIEELALAPILAARTLIETEPNYAKASARLLLNKLRREALTHVFGCPAESTQAEMQTGYADYFHAYIKAGIAAELLDPELSRFDLSRLAAALKPERDLQFDYLGFQTLYDR